MCETHYKKHGLGLGTGYGQRVTTGPATPELPAPLIVGAVLESKRKATTVGDSCLEAAVEEGAPDDLESVTLIMTEMGADVADHLCDQAETGGDVPCLCACLRRRY